MSAYTRRRGRPTLGQVLAAVSPNAEPRARRRRGDVKVMGMVDGDWMSVGPSPPVGNRFHLFARGVKVWFRLARARALKSYIRCIKGGVKHGIRKGEVVLVSPTARLDAKIQRLEGVLEGMFRH